MHVAGSAVAAWAGLKACWYRAVRSWVADGHADAARVRAGVTVASASATLARKWLSPQHRLAGLRVELQALAGGADQFRAVTVSQCPGDEGLRPGPASGLPADLERTAAPTPAPDRIYAHIKPVHLYPLIAAGTWIAALSAVAVTRIADGAARPYSRLSVGRTAGAQWPTARAPAAAVLYSAAMRALHCRYDRGHWPG